MPVLITSLPELRLVLFTRTALRSGQAIVHVTMQPVDAATTAYESSQDVSHLLHQHASQQAALSAEPAMLSHGMPSTQAANSNHCNI
jgi:hypothetical protein